MIREFVIPRHPGFYESILSNSDEFVDNETQDTEEFIEKFDIKGKFGVICEYTDFNKFMLDVSNQIGKLVVDEVESEFLPYDNIKYLDAEVDSPEYYNYTTDRGFARISVDGYVLEKIKDIAFNQFYDELNELIKDTFTSYDGFVSFYSNDINKWRAKSVFDYDHNELGMLFNVLHRQIQDTESWVLDLSEIAMNTKYEYTGLIFVYEDKYYSDEIDYDLKVSDLLRVLGLPEDTHFAPW